MRRITSRASGGIRRRSRRDHTRGVAGPRRCAGRLDRTDGAARSFGVGSGRRRARSVRSGSGVVGGIASPCRRRRRGTGVRVAPVGVSAQRLRPGRGVRPCPGRPVRRTRVVRAVAPRRAPCRGTDAAMARASPGTVAWRFGGIGAPSGSRRVAPGAATVTGRARGTGCHCDVRPHAPAPVTCGPGVGGVGDVPANVVVAGVVDVSAFGRGVVSMRCGTPFGRNPGSCARVPADEFAAQLVSVCPGRVDLGMGLAASPSSRMIRETVRATYTGQVVSSPFQTPACSHRP
ncbi:hypothetical protein UA75_16625 [Actinoalloteichus sp. GBA129-24]|uniref:Uncharacterized protein n=1 Tax=Actinoalloteichus fjordicus TaxID=1612552 RepID=A0AAC9LC76_9PSEU|nr:hypothetical protein UA74_16200 [Actinoalloteichus fjordicus]APU21333.1 hypothetical protein UA75_16625 [Actinoalloteichus sp. GBA129-24]